MKTIANDDLRSAGDLNDCLSFGCEAEMAKAQAVESYKMLVGNGEGVRAEPRCKSEECHRSDLIELQGEFNKQPDKK